MNITVFELQIGVFLKEDVSIEDATRQITFLIDKCLMENQRGKYSEFHKSLDFKNYCYDSLFPLEQDRVYKKEKEYSFRIRTVDPSLADFFKKELPQTETLVLKGIRSKCNIIPKKKIKKIYSITPLLVKTEDGYWKNNFSFTKFREKIYSNIFRKYLFFTKTSEDHFIKENSTIDLFSNILFKNKVPVKVKYKNSHLLGDKVDIEVNLDSASQELAYFILGVGLGEMNSRGFGFFNAHFF